MILQKRSTIKIPKEILILYCAKTHLLTISNKIKIRSLKVQTEIFALPASGFITVSDKILKNKNIPLTNNNKVIQQVTVAKIKLAVYEITNTFYNKLSFVGVGYRAALSEISKRQLVLKLGFSHSIYVKIPKSIKICCVKSTKLFLQGNDSLNLITQFAAYIRNCKIPEPYKGKGILQNDEKVVLKKGKKV